jgi:cytoskeletal protein CcmA (bactofilin family)
VRNLIRDQEQLRKRENEAISPERRVKRLQHSGVERVFHPPFNSGVVTMAIWKESAPQKREDTPVVTIPGTPVLKEPEAAPAPARAEVTPSYNAPRRVEAEAKESLIAAGLTIEGKIEGAGHVRVAGRFTGDVHVQGDVTIERGAKVSGGVRANTIVIAGELEGNIEGASRVELLDSGILNGDVKAGSLTVAAGSRMRGQAEFGWDEKVSMPKREGGAAA